MGNQFSTTTLGLTKDCQGFAYWVGIDWKPFYNGSRKNCYHGYLNGLGPRAGEKVVVKSFLDFSGTQEAWKEELMKTKTAQYFADAFTGQFNFVKINVDIPQVALMDTVSKMNQRYDSRGRSRSLSKDDWVSIERNITGEFQRFRCDVIDAFTHFTFQHSGGQAVVCDLQGVMDGDHYKVTDPVVHSVRGSFGKQDKGITGINEFFKVHRCNSICSEWPSMLPLSPPPAFEDIVNLPWNMLSVSNSFAHTPPLYENVVFAP